MTDKATPRSYLPIDGIPAYDKAVQSLLLGADSELVALGRAVTVQALGGTGGLRIGADFLRKFAPAAQVRDQQSRAGKTTARCSRRRVFRSTCIRTTTPRRTDSISPRMRAALDAMSPGTIVVLHACCHNPTGVDPTPEQWDEILATVRARGLVPFLDLAYQGFGDGIEADAVVVRKFAATPGPLFISSSFSKSFSLYGERVGACTVVTADKDEAARVLSQLKRVVRANYSNPPTHGGQIVALVLTNAQLREIWEIELGGMRERIREMRESLVEKLAERAPGHDFEFVRSQRGMFSYSGLEPRSRCSGCATSSRFTPSTRDASAWQRSTRGTSSTWPTRSPPCWCRYRWPRQLLTHRTDHPLTPCMDRPCNG